MNSFGRSPSWHWIAGIALGLMLWPVRSPAQAPPASPSPKPAEEKRTAEDPGLEVQVPQLLYLAWQKEDSRPTDKEAPPTLWDMDGKVLSDKAARWLLEQVRYFSTGPRREGQLHPLVFVFSVDQRMAYCPVSPILITADGRRHEGGFSARSQPTNGLNVSTAAPQKSEVEAWSDHITLEIKYPIENVTVVKTLADIPDEPVTIAPGVSWYLDSSRALEVDRQARQTRRADGKTAGVLQVDRAAADPLVSYEANVYLRDANKPLRVQYVTIIEPEGRLCEIRVSEPLADKEAIQRLEITRLRHAVRRIDKVPLRLDLLPKDVETRPN